MSEKRFEVIAKEILELRKEMREEFRQYRIDAQAEFNLHRTVMQGALEQLQLNQRADASHGRGRQLSSLDGGGPCSSSRSKDAASWTTWTIPEGTST